ncbi:MAG: acyl-CoA mutase large subunit family protein, partial [Muribaculaceae bacterium]|nr:acyl-CoA mutase large subunit family protein [Muribaculaceae bacterium]
MAETKKLFDQFAPVTPEEWRAKAEVDLKGADFEKKMVWRTNEGFSAQPLYRSVDIADLKQTKSLPGEFPYVRGTRYDNDWKVRQNIDVDDVHAANAKALDVLNKGINSIGFHMHAGDVDLKTLLAGINLPACEINIQCCPKCAVGYAKQLVELCKENGCMDTFVGSIAFDPFKRTLKHGQPFPGDIVAIATELMNVAKPVAHLRVLSVDSLMLNNAGAYIYQELGYALAWGAEWMAMMTEAGFTADEVANRIKFNMGVSTVYFMEIAKFRAARELWALIVKQFNPANDYSCMMNVNAETSRFNQTMYDSYVNLLRTQTEAMSAALACVDSIVVTPFDAPYKKSDDFSERIARNQQILLKEESHLDKVVDPAGGSYYVEMLTKNLAEQGWKLFLDVEDKGGFKAALESGDIIDAVNKSANERFDKVAKRREQLLGTNQFPNFTEKAADKADARSACHCCCKGEEPEGAVGLNNKRLAEQ